MGRSLLKLISIICIISFVLPLVMLLPIQPDRKLMELPGRELLDIMTIA